MASRPPVQCSMTPQGFQIHGSGALLSAKTVVKRIISTEVCGQRTFAVICEYKVVNSGFQLRPDNNPFTGYGGGGVGRYNAEGNRSIATPELLRCNAKVIRPLDQASRRRWGWSYSRDVTTGDQCSIREPPKNSNRPPGVPVRRPCGDLSRCRVCDRQRRNESLTGSRVTDSKPPLCNGTVPTSKPTNGREMDQFRSISVKSGKFGLPGVISRTARIARWVSRTGQHAPAKGESTRCSQCLIACGAFVTAWLMQHAATGANRS